MNAKNECYTTASTPENHFRNNTFRAAQALCDDPGRRTLSGATDHLEKSLHVAVERAANIERALFGGDRPKDPSGAKAPDLPGVDEGIMRCQHLLVELLAHLEDIEERA